MWREVKNEFSCKKFFVSESVINTDRKIISVILKDYILEIDGVKNYHETLKIKEILS